MTTSEPDPRSVLATAQWRSVSDPQRITQGWDTLLWRFKGEDARDHALRLYRQNGTAEGRASAAEQEGLAMRAARAGGVLVPEIEATGVFDSAPFFVLQWMEGRPLFDVARSRLWQLPAIARAFGRAQAQLHRVPPPPGLRIRDAAFIDETVSHAGLAAALKRELRADTYCHLDYHPLNVLGSGTDITAVLDFGSASVADRRMDLAVTHATLLYTPSPPDWTRLLVRLLRKLFHRNWKAGYLKEAGSFPLNALFEAFGAYRVWHEANQAVSEGRGWLKQPEVEGLRKNFESHLVAAGLA